MENRVDVSIICLAYNHEKYIRQCLDGFVMQKGVTFEIIIHDDASTDNTADIIREYESKYPDLFRPIYQTENQYSKHTGIIKTFMVPKITGKYVALCEGDDYWTDPYKLKKQFDALDDNQDCYMCLHNVEVVDKDGVKVGRNMPKCQIPTGIMTSKAFFDIYEKAEYYQTSSYFVLAQKYVDYISNPPHFRRVAPVGDDPLLMYFAYFGNVFYLDEVMSNYRWKSEGSWSNRMNDNTNYTETWKMQDEYVLKIQNMLKEFSVFSGGKYDKQVAFLDQSEHIYEVQKNDKFWFYINTKKYNKLLKEFSLAELKEFGLSYKAIIKIIVQSFAQCFYK